jgi:hypothetical protein
MLLKREFPSAARPSFVSCMSQDVSYRSFFPMHTAQQPLEFIDAKEKHMVYRNWQRHAVIAFKPRQQLRTKDCAEIEIATQKEIVERYD